jgi:acyl-CoA thioesterase
VDLAELLDSLATDPAGGHRVEVPPDWGQGRTLYGGANAALAARCGRALDTELGPLRAIQVAFIAPAAGTLSYVPTLLRRGRSVSFVGVDCFAGSDLCTRTILTYGRARETAVVHSRVSTPQLPTPEGCPEVRLVPGVTPAFLEHMEIRLAGGSPPLSGGEPEFAMWVRHREPAGLDAESAAVAVADALPPAVSAGQAEFRPTSSVTWTVDFAPSLPEPGGWYLMSTASEQAAGGYSLQAMRCFGADGGLIAAGRQTVAVF